MKFVSFTLGYEAIHPLPKCALTKLYDELFVPNSELNDIDVDLHSFSRTFFESVLLTEYFCISEILYP